MKVEIYVPVIYAAFTISCVVNLRENISSVHLWICVIQIWGIQLEYDKYINKNVW